MPSCGLPLVQPKATVLGFDSSPGLIAWPGIVIGVFSFRGFAWSTMAKATTTTSTTTTRFESQLIGKLLFPFKLWPHTNSRVAVLPMAAMALVALEVWHSNARTMKLNKEGGELQHTQIESLFCIV